MAHMINLEQGEELRFRAVDMQVRGCVGSHRVISWVVAKELRLSYRSGSNKYGFPIIVT